MCLAKNECELAQGHAHQHEPDAGSIGAMRGADSLAHQFWIGRQAFHDPVYFPSQTKIRDQVGGSCLVDQSFHYSFRK
jgi:hypothetical protein